MQHPPLCSRRRPLAALGGLALLAALGLNAAPARAQGAFPDKLVKFVVNFPPGGPADILARSVADVLQASLKQPFVVENKPDASVPT